MSSVKEEIELHISFLEGKLNAFGETATLFPVKEHFRNGTEGSAQLSLAVSLIKQELAFLKKLIDVYYTQE
jgi:hypothetical protein